MEKFKKSGLEKQVSKIPKKVLWCKKCVISNQRPRIIFDSSGICSGCKNQEKKKNINWERREKELIELLDGENGVWGNKKVCCTEVPDESTQRTSRRSISIAIYGTSEGFETNSNSRRRYQRLKRI